MQKYRIISKKGEGTFSEVMKAVSLVSNKQFAIKCMKRKFETVEEVNRLFEVQALRKLAGHPHIVQLHDVLFEDHRLALVFELMDMNVYEVMKDRKSYLPEARVTRWMYQLFQAIQYMHKHHLFHRDVKPENLLIMDDTLKLADLGSSCALNARQPFTEYISTRWYRAPECLLTSGYYSYKMDIWAAGCVFYELMTLNPIFPGKNELDQINKIHAILGTPSEDTLSAFRKLSGDHLKDVKFAPVRGTGFTKKLTHCSGELTSLVVELLNYDHSKRPNASQVVKHPFFAHHHIATPPVVEVRQTTRKSLYGQASSLSPASSSTRVESTTPRPPPTPPALRVVGESKSGVNVPPLVLSKHTNNPYWKSARSKSTLFPKKAEPATISARYRYLSQTHRQHAVGPPHMYKY